MKRYMAGTPNIDVMWNFSMFSSTMPGSNICSMTTVAPFMNAQERRHVETADVEERRDDERDLLGRSVVGERTS